MKINWSKILISYFSVLILVVFLSSVAAIVFAGNLYQSIFSPVYNSGLLTLGGEGLDTFLGGFLLSYALLLPLLSFLIISSKKWICWLIFIIPFLFFFLTDSKWFSCFIILTILGGLIGWLIKLVYTKIKKQ